MTQCPGIRPHFCLLYIMTEFKVNRDESNYIGNQILNNLFVQGKVLKVFYDSLGSINQFSASMSTGSSLSYSFNSQLIYFLTSPIKLQTCMKIRCATVNEQYTKVHVLAQTLIKIIFQRTISRSQFS